MTKPAAAEAFDFTSSFQRTLGRFETLGKDSKTDYERARLKLLQEVSKIKGSLEETANDD